MKIWGNCMCSLTKSFVLTMPLRRFGATVPLNQVVCSYYATQKFGATVPLNQVVYVYCACPSICWGTCQIISFSLLSNKVCTTTKMHILEMSFCHGQMSAPNLCHCCTIHLRGCNLNSVQTPMQGPSSMQWFEQVLCSGFTSPFMKQWHWWCKENANFSTTTKIAFKV